MYVLTEIRFHADGNGKINFPQEYKSLVSYGNAIKAMITYLYSKDVVLNDRICNFVNTLGDPCLIGLFAVTDS